ncbi:hypothetical protein MW887_003662 [Aspergillus wentii]|nr:hypothetical protein MW887_003662 [Aspergillus wentii]
MSFSRCGPTFSHFEYAYPPSPTLERVDMFDDVDDVGDDCSLDTDEATSIATEILLDDDVHENTYIPEDVHALCSQAEADSELYDQIQVVLEYHHIRVRDIRFQVCQSQQTTELALAARIITVRPVDEESARQARRLIRWALDQRGYGLFHIMITDIHPGDDRPFTPQEEEYIVPCTWDRLVSLINDEEYFDQPVWVEVNHIGDPSHQIQYLTLMCEGTGQQMNVWVEGGEMRGISRF